MNISSSTRAKLELTLRAYIVVATAVFLVTGTVYLVLGRWPVTHQDFWRIYDTCLHRSWLYSALLKYNGHSHFFPSQLWLADLRFFHGNQDFLFAAGLLFQVLGTALLALPVSLDRARRLTTKLSASMVLVVFSFWMGRASMTASGGFNCCYSLVLTGAAIGFLSLDSLARREDRNKAGLLLAVIFGNVLASFSFGTGLATWIASLATAYCLDLRLRSLAVLAAAATLTVLTFMALPAREAGNLLPAHLQIVRPSTYLTLLTYLCHMLGSPLAHICAAPTSHRNPPTDQFTSLPTTLGAIGLALASIIIVLKIRRRNLEPGLETIGFFLLAFNLIAFAVITLGRADHIRLFPPELNAPRYYYWSTLFWTGLILFALCHSESWAPSRIPMLCAVLAIPILIFPSHCREGVRWRYVRLTSRQAATSLINGVHDPTQISILSPFPDLVYRLAREMRTRRLDMFAPGYQDWLGRPASTVFSRDRAHLNGRCQVRSLATRPPSVRVSGSAVDRGGITPEIMVITDSNDVIRGLARSSATPKWIDRLLYSRMFQPRGFVGFITGYDPRLQYSVRSIERNRLSSEAIEVPEAAESVPAARPNLNPKKKN